jgi:hypothetical protein
MKHFITGILLLIGFIHPVFAASMWSSLNAVQREALSPLAQQWGYLPDQQQLNLLRIAQSYPKLTPTEKQRFQKKLIAWSKLTPEQRKTARERYRSLSKNALAKRQHKQNSGIASSSVPQISAPIPASSISSIASSVEATQPSH